MAHSASFSIALPSTTVQATRARRRDARARSSAWCKRAAPHSTARRVSDSRAMARISVTPTLDLDESELEESFIQATGPGGQNVNKVATAVQLRFGVARS